MRKKIPDKTRYTRGKDNSLGDRKEFARENYRT